MLPTPRPSGWNRDNSDDRWVAPERSAPKSCAPVKTLSTKVYYRSLTNRLETDISKCLKTDGFFGVVRAGETVKSAFSVPKLDALSP